MSLIFMDSMQAGDYASRYINAPSSARGTSTPRVTGGAYTSALGAGGSSLQKRITAVSEIFVAVAFQPVSLGIQIILLGDVGVTSHLTIVRNTSSGFLELRRGSSTGTLIATGTTVVPATSWTQIQVRATIADSGGICQVRINGSTTNDIDYTGDTKNAGTATTIDTVVIGNTSGSTSSLVTDLVILDTAGSSNNTWPGDVRVVCLSPSGDGNASQWVGSDGNSVSNYQQVDELPFASSDYNGSPTVGNQDVYALSDLPAGITDIRAVQICGSLAKSDAGAVAAKLVTRSGGTDYKTSSITLSTTYATYMTVYDTDPATSTTWTASGVNALQAGAEVA